MGNGICVYSIILMMVLMVISVGDPGASMAGKETDLGDSNASFLGEVAGDLCREVAGAGDVNGDGFDDFLIGAMSSDENGDLAGQTYLVLGKKYGWSLDYDLSKADASFLGKYPGDLSGASLAGAGDVNGDGFDDILIGARYSDTGGFGSGQAYLIFGKASRWWMDTALSKSDASFTGEDVSDAAGWAVAGAGDVNGDGYDDILISAMHDEEGGTDAGQTYLILGKASGWSMDVDLSNADASFIGEEEDDDSGCSVTGAGDVNGDGYDDLLIAAYHNDEGGIDAGQTYLIFGKSSGWSMDTDLSFADASFIGEDDYDLTGGSVAGVGDVDGDGYDDILIGAPNDDEGGFRAGQSYLILGKASGWSMDTDLSDADASFWGEDTEDRAGFSVAGAGNVNGDEYDDILIGALGDEAGGGTNSGQTYIILGKASEWSMDTNLSTADASFLGEGDGDFSGCSVAGAGDVNGDGFDDILIGSFGKDIGQAGQTYLIFVTWDRDYDGVPNAVDAFPTDKAASLDTDGDGFPDQWNTGMTKAHSTTGLRLDAFPLDIAASLDKDGDGYPDEWNQGMSANDSTSDPKLVLDAFPNDSSEWLDTDKDGYGDNRDAFPEDPLEWLDADDDGHGNNEDRFPEDPLEWADADDDGHGDNGDAFPADPLEWADADGDGHGDNGDAFPADPLEWVDGDGDGHGDNEDAFPNNALEWADADADGHGDNGDAFPNDASEWADADADGHGDNGDAFPADVLEWSDADGDGHGDNGDAFPDDPLEWTDTDEDGVGDNADAFPDDPAASTDTDEDGYPDEWNTGRTRKDSTTGLQLDELPDDPKEWKAEESPGFGAVLALLGVLIGLAAFMMKKKGEAWVED